jgi:hypothetical protein
MGNDLAKYNEWRGAFGNVYFGSGSGGSLADGSGSAVPEPITCTSLLILGALVAIGRPRRR